MKSERILVTGCLGFIGSHFVDYIAEFGDCAHIIGVDLLCPVDRLMSCRLNCVQKVNYDSLEPEITLLQMDICNVSSMKKLFSKYEFDRLVHFAAKTHVDDSIKSPEVFVSTNVRGTFVLLELARKYSVKFYYVSTDEVYGSLDPESPPMQETERFDPSSPYAATKAAGEHLVNSYHKTYGLYTVITRSCNNYGPRQDLTKLIPKVIKCCKFKQDIPIYHDGTQTREWIHVQDHCRALSLVVKYADSGQVYNIGTSIEMSNIELVKRICGIADELEPGFKHETLIKFVKDRPGHDLRYAVDSTKLRNSFSWTPEVSFQEGLKQTVEWYWSILDERFFGSRRTD